MGASSPFIVSHLVLREGHGKSSSVAGFCGLTVPMWSNLSAEIVPKKYSGVNS